MTGPHDIDRPAGVDDAFEDRLRSMLQERAGTIVGPPPPIGVRPEPERLAEAVSITRRPPRRANRWLAVAAAVVLVGAGAIAVRVSRGDRPQVDSGAAEQPAVNAVDPLLPARYDLRTARPVLTVTGTPEDAARAWLSARQVFLEVPGDPATLDLRADGTVAGTTRFRWSVDDPDGCLAVPPASCTPVGDAAGTIYVRSADDRSAVVAATTPGISFADLTYEDGAVVGSVDATLPPGAGAQVTLDTVDLQDHRARTTVVRSATEGLPAGRSVRAPLPPVPSNARAVIARAGTVGDAGRALGEVRLDRVGAPAPAEGRRAAAAAAVEGGGTLSLGAPGGTTTLWTAPAPGEGGPSTPEAAAGTFLRALLGVEVTVAPTRDPRQLTATVPGGATITVAVAPEPDGQGRWSVEGLGGEVPSLSQFDDRAEDVVLADAIGIGFRRVEGLARVDAYASFGPDTVRRTVDVAELAPGGPGDDAQVPVPDGGAAPGAVIVVQRGEDGEVLAVTGGRYP